tara:strand:+ start:397 stop:1212 length:816 start_codon:yes stop_codon:yes gene_type:complete
MSKSFCSIFIVFILLFSLTESNAQNIDNKKGNFYSYWGWNFSWYTKSNINFKGDNYDFTIHKATAQDRQTKFTLNNYLNPANITIPQYNFRFGYFIKDNIDVSFGIDHLKYVLEQNQLSRISGFIENSGTKYDGVYNNTLLPISEDFLKFEHSDGLNYINFEIRKHSLLSNNDKLKLNTISGVGLGFMLPKTNATLLNKERNDDFYLSGYGFHTVLGLNIKFYKNFFIQTELKGGYTSLPNIRTSKFKSDKASQNFFYAQYNLVFGYLWKL